MLLREKDERKFKALSDAAVASSKVPPQPQLLPPLTKTAAGATSLKSDAPVPDSRPVSKTFNQLIDIYRKKVVSPAPEVSVPEDVNVVRGRLEVLKLPGNIEEFKDVDTKKDSTPYSLFGGSSFTSMSFNSPAPSFSATATSLPPPPPGAVAAAGREKHLDLPSTTNPSASTSTAADELAIPNKIVYTIAQLRSVRQRNSSTFLDHSGGWQNGSTFVPGVTKNNSRGSGNSTSSSSSNNNSNNNTTSSRSSESASDNRGDADPTASSATSPSPQLAATPGYTREIKKGFTIDMPI